MRILVIIPRAGAIVDTGEKNGKGYPSGGASMLSCTRVKRHYDLEQIISSTLWRDYVRASRLPKTIPYRGCVTPIIQLMVSKKSLLVFMCVRLRPASSIRCLFMVKLYK
jgi:hypothetical protein